MVIAFEKFKKAVIDENYDIITLPETVLPPTEDKGAVSIPNYSLVENRKNSGDGVLMYIKDSLKYKVVDLTVDNPDVHVSLEDLLDKLKKEGKFSMMSFVIWHHRIIYHQFSLTDLSRILLNEKHCHHLIIITWHLFELESHIYS